MIDLLSILLSLAYIVAVVGAVVSQGWPDTATLRGLSRAVRLGLIASGLALASVFVELLDDDGWAWVGLAVFKLGCALVMTHFIRVRRDLKGEQIQAEAERTIRDYLREGH